MQMESLKIFCAVARCRSFSHAAEESDITQSAVSQIVSQLEKRMNVQLVDRSTRPLKLTALGLEYYEGCKALLEQYEELEARIRNTKVEILGTALVAAIYSVGLSDMDQLVQRFEAENPRAQVRIDYTHPDQVYDRLKDGTADLGLVSYPKKAADLSATSWREEPMVLACAPKHPLASRLALPISALDGQRYVHFDKNLVVRRRVDKFLREQHVAVDVVAEFDSIENIKQAVSLGQGVALLPEPTIRREVKARTLSAVALFGCKLTRPLAIVHRRGQRLSAAAKRFMDLLLEAEAKSPGAADNSPPPTSNANTRGTNGVHARPVKG
ncbi:MAG TPA: LysR family transcriptional regulator [Gemmataceae bacterium]|nr:LysR family transcriptional regulator [Gemmataceae bacterium]